jgi:hypothetical protein
MDGPRFDRRGLSGHAHDLVAIRLDANGVDTLAAQVLDQAETRPFFLNEERVIRSNGAPAMMMLKDDTPEIRILQTGPHNVEEIDRFPARQ